MSIETTGSMHRAGWRKERQLACLRPRKRFEVFLLLVVASGVSCSGRSGGHLNSAGNAEPPPRAAADRGLDRTGLKRFGKASFYADEFAGRKMADGTPMLPQGNNAASKTLPLGTTAKVIDLETGKTAVITIRDRGPYVRGRIVDLSPATARKIGIDRKQGVAEVAVIPIALPASRPANPQMPNYTVERFAQATARSADKGAGATPR